MATKKAASAKKKATVARPVSTNKTTVRTVRADEKVVKKPVVQVSEKSAKVVAVPAVKSASAKDTSILPDNIVNIVFGELFGTFALSLVVLLTLKETSVLYIGLVIAALSVALGAVSGAHFNPAITFAKWTMRQLRSVLLPFYWGAQFLGAMIAILVMNWVTGGSMHTDFSRLWSMNWSLFGVELVAALVLMFGFAAASNKVENSPLARGLSAGIAVLAGLIVGTSLLASVQSAIDTSKITALNAIPHELRVKGVSANPAVALVQTEQTDAAYSGTFNKNEKQVSRLSLEVVLGSLVGAAIGGNLYLLIAGRHRKD